jgi:hypothetical protein
MNLPLYRSSGVFPPAYYEFTKCEHLTLSLFCAIQCWINGWDGIRISRDQLKQFLKLKRLKEIRFEWIKRDFEELFPFQRPDYPSTWYEFSRKSFEEQPVIEECRIPKRSNPDKKFGLLEELHLPTFNWAILEIFMHHIKKD